MRNLQFCPAVLTSLILSFFLGCRPQGELKKPRTLAPRQDALSPPRGVFALTNTNNWVTVDGKRVDLFTRAPAGLTSYGHWSSMEPKRKEFNWRGFRRQVFEARQTGKKLAYGILAGTHAPDWAKKLPGTKTWKVTYGNGTVRTCFLPWTEKSGGRVLNETMLAAWDETVQEFARVVHSLPGYRSLIAYVPITGGPSTNGLEIMWAAGRYDEFKALKWGAAEDELLAEYWKHCVLIFLKHFPDVPLGLAITDYVGRRPSGQGRRNLSVARSVLDFAVAEAERRHALIMPMGLWIGIPGLRKIQHPLTSLLFSYAPRCPIGLQCQMGTPTAAEVEAILGFALEHNVSWIEFWHHDIIREDYLPILRKYHPKFFARGEGQTRSEVISFEIR